MRISSLSFLLLLAWTVLATARAHEDEQHAFVSPIDSLKFGGTTTRQCACLLAQCYPNVPSADEYVLGSLFPEHTLRITEPDAFCDSVKQYQYP